MQAATRSCDIPPTTAVTLSEAVNQYGVVPRKVPINKEKSFNFTPKNGAILTFSRPEKSDIGNEACDRTHCSND